MRHGRSSDVPPPRSLRAAGFLLVHRQPGGRERHISSNAFHLSNAGPSQQKVVCAWPGTSGPLILVLLYCKRASRRDIDEAFRRRLEKRVLIPLPDLSARKQLLDHLLKQQQARLLLPSLHTASWKLR